MTRRVVITGLGALSPVGNNVEEAWANLLAGKSGIAEITLFETTDLAVKIGGEVKGFVAEDWIDPKEARHMDRSVQFAVVAAEQAVKDSGIDMANEDPDRVGIIIGSAAGGVGTLVAQQTIFMERGARRVSPHFLPNFLVDRHQGRWQSVSGRKALTWPWFRPVRRGLMRWVRQWRRSSGGMLT